MIWDSLQLSLLVVGVSTLIVGAAGIIFAYILARGDFYGRELLDALLTMPLVLPPTVTGYYLIVLLGRKGIIGSYLYELTGWTFVFTWEGAVIAAIVVSLPLMIKAARAGLESVDPNYEKVSYTLGKSKLKTFFLVTLPLAKKGIIAGLILSFARALGEFGATLMIAGNIQGKTQTMPLAIYEAVTVGDEKQAQILALILTAVSILAIYLTNKISSFRF